MTVKYVLSNHLHVTGLPHSFKEFYQSYCQYNTDSYASQDIPPNLNLFVEEEDGSIRIPRGLESQLVSFLDQHGIDYSCEDQTAQGSVEEYVIRPEIEYESGPYGYQGRAVKDLIKHRTGRLASPAGCHAEGSKILMYNGLLKNVEDIKVGDLLMGPDSLPRKVLKLFSGQEEMFRITPVKGEPFVVNKSHILHLVRTCKNRKYKDSNKSKQVSRRKPGGSTVDITVSEYLEKSKTFKHLHKLLRTGIEFNDPIKHLLIDPYHLGVILGDGTTSRQITVTTADQEIVETFPSICKKYCLQQHRVDNKNTGKASTYFFKSAMDSGVKTKLKNNNILIDRLKALKLWGTTCGDKFIPNDYKVSTRKDRLEILAGLIDTDGYLACGYFEFCSKSKKLAEDVTFISRSLGFAAYIAIKVINGVNYYRVNISGNISLIPTRIARKKASPRRQKKSVLRTGFSVEPTGLGTYYGFLIDSDHLYVTSDFTIHHNSGKTCMACLATAMLQEGPILFLVNKDKLFRQFVRTVTKVLGIPKEEVGVIKAKKHVIKPITCGSLKTLGKEGFDLESLQNTFTTVFFDECHISSALTYRRVLCALAPKRLYGLSATPKHYASDDLNRLMDSLLGPIVVRVNPEEIPDRLNPETYTRETGCQLNFSENPGDPEWMVHQNRHKLMDEILHHENRNSLIINDCKRLLDLGFKLLVAVNRVEHGRVLHLLFEKEGIASSFPYKKVTKLKKRRGKKVYDKHGEPVRVEGLSVDHKKLDLDLEEIEDGNISVLIGTYEMFDTGFDCPCLSAVIMAAPFSGRNTNKAIQLAGRIQRFQIGKDQAVVLDYTDDSYPTNVLRKWSDSRAITYQQEFGKHDIIPFSQ